MKLKKLTRPFEIKSVNEDGSFSGYATVFGQPDFYGDIILPGALNETLTRKRNGGVVGLWQHDDDDPIATYPVLKVDSTGLYVEGQLVKGVQQADEAHLLLKAKAINGMSMGFITQEDDYNQSGQRLIKKLDLWEISLVTFPAHDSARVTDVKSVSELCKLADVEQYLRDEGGFSAREAKAIVSRIKAIGSQRDADSSLEIKKALEILKSKS